MPEPSIDRSELARSLVDRLGDRRWYSAKSSAIERVDVRGWWPIGDSVLHTIVGVDTTGGTTADYQLPLIEQPAGHDVPHTDVPHTDGPHTDGPVTDALVVDAGRRWVDALAAPEGIAAYVPLFAGEATVAPTADSALGLADTALGPLEFRSFADGFADLAAMGRPLGVEQSNTSVVVGDRILIKFFRQLSDGENPDVEIHRALGRVGCPHVAQLRGWAQTTVAGRTTTIAMAQDFLAGAVDGFAAAVEALRSGAVGELVAAADRLGEAVAVVHRDLHRSLGGGQVDAATVAVGLADRIDELIGRVPRLAPYRERAAELVAAVGVSGPVTVHRVHGDLHLGQVLDTDGRWVVIDFEGEPGTDPAVRRAPDSPLRDVAGMLRSYDYAAAVAGGGPAAVSGARAAAEAFSAGYARRAEVDPRAHPALLAAYQLDKAVYEVDYEARNRPDWIVVPLAAVQSILTFPIG